jgi:Dna[CI] antecedent, DciA
VSGVDLARVPLRAALEVARKNGGNTRAAKPRSRTTSVVRRDGREPMGLGAAIGALVTERAWELPAAGATLRERRETIAPELAGHVVAVGYDPDSGWLTVCPESAAWAGKALLEQARVIEAANASAGRRSCVTCESLRLAPCPRPLRAPSIYLHFKDKTELVWTVRADAYRVLAAEMAEAGEAAAAGGATVGADVRHRRCVPALRHRQAPQVPADVQPGVRARGPHRL